MSACLLDTNILLRLVQPQSSGHESIRKAVELLWARGEELCYTSQNLAEFWNVCTRPANRNGFGFSLARVDADAALLESKLILLEDSLETHNAWRKLVVAYGVSGVQVHDARLIAAMQVHRVPLLLTLNSGDFRRYSGITLLKPEDVIAG